MSKRIVISPAVKNIASKSQEFIGGIIFLILCNAFTQVFAQQPVPKKTFVEEALSLYAKRDYNSLEKASEILAEGLTKDASNMTAHALIATINAQSAYLSWQMGNKDTALIEDAAGRAEAAYAAEPKNPYVLKARGRIFLLQGNRQEAGKMFEQALGANTNDPEAWYLYACASDGSYFDTETPAYKRIMKSLELEPGFLWAVTDILSLSLEGKEYEAATEWLALLKQNHPNSAEYLFYKGLLEMHQKKPAEGKATLSEFLKKAPESPLASIIEKNLK